MPALPPAANVIKSRVSWSVEGNTLAQTIHYWRWSGSAGSSGDLSSFASALISEGETQFAGLCSNYVGMQSATVIDLSSAMGVEAEGGSPWSGTRGTAVLPPAASAVVAHQIARHYRGGHPRTYLPVGISTDIVTTGLWTSAFAGDVETAWGAWVAAVTATYGSLDVSAIVNVSYYGPPNRTVTGSTGRVRTLSTVRSAPIIDTITGHTVGRVIGSQRRRNRDA